MVDAKCEIKVSIEDQGWVCMWTDSFYLRVPKHGFKNNSASAHSFFNVIKSRF